MQVQRLEFEVKRGCMPEAVTLLKAMPKEGNVLPIKRVYTSRIGQQNVIAMELEWESLAEYEKGWAKWDARPQATAFLKSLNELLELSREEIWESVSM